MILLDFSKIFISFFFFLIFLEERRLEFIVEEKGCLSRRYFAWKSKCHQGKHVLSGTRSKVETRRHHVPDLSRISSGNRDPLRIC